MSAFDRGKRGNKSIYVPMLNGALVQRSTGTAPAATEIPPDSTPGTTQNATCGALLVACVCALAAEHEGAHECRCKGAWTGSEATGDLDVVRFPEVRDDGSLNALGIALNMVLEQ